MAAKLAFVHITKTGGSSIEQWGKEHGYLWGINDPRLQTALSRNVRNKNGIPCASKWHVPPSYFVENPYSGRYTFTVVRHPYSRLVSEFFCPYGGSKKRKPTRTFFNRWICDLVRRENIVSGLPQTEYLPVDCVLHFETLQHDFNNLMNTGEAVTLPHINRAKSRCFTVRD